MARTGEQNALGGAARLGSATPVPSQGLEWLWQHLRDVRRPHILDCGPVSPATLRVLLHRGAKFYAADLISPALEEDPRFWDRTAKTPVFLCQAFLAQLPEIAGGSLNAILSWNLLDLAPRQSLPDIVGRLFSLLQPLGVLFCILREPYHKAGVERRWWLETLSSARNECDSKRPCPQPVVSNREIERLLPGASTKIFLTRSGRREILAMRQQ